MPELTLLRPSVRQGLAILGLLAALAVVMVLMVEPRFGGSAPPKPMVRAKPYALAPQTYDAALREVDRSVASSQAMVKAQGEQWLVLEQLARAAMARARLTGSFDDYALADDAMRRAFATAPAGAGPHLTAAVLDFSLHRLAATQQMLDAIDRYVIPPDQPDLVEAAALRGDLEFYRGRYAEALRRYGKDAETESQFRLAVYHGRTGDPDQALAALDRMEQGATNPTALFLASLELQRGGLELQRGDWPAARARFARADTLFPGYWLTQAHLAQMDAVEGAREQAIARYLALLRKTQVPEAMDALAAVYRAQADYPNMRLWADRAGAIWARRLEQLPEAAYGHAVEHELAYGDPRRALDLALKDHALRPYGGSATALTWAYLANNRPADAVRTIEPVLASAWRSADSYMAASRAYLLAGQADKAEAAQRTALEINPRAAAPTANLIWFGH